MGDAHSDAAGHEEAVWFWRIVGAFLAAHEFDVARLMVERCNSVLYVKEKLSPERRQEVLANIYTRASQARPRKYRGGIVP